MNNTGTGQTRRSFLLKAAGVAGTTVLGSSTFVNDALGASASEANSKTRDAAQPIQVNFEEISPSDPSLYGRYLNIIGNGAPFTEQDFQLYQEQFGRLKLVRIWGTNHIDYAAQIADEALMVPQSHLRKPVPGGQQSGFAGENVLNSEGFIDLKKLAHGEVAESECVAVAERYLGEVKAKYPFVTHIEPFNELTGEWLDLPMGMSVEEAYYKGFRVAYLAANSLNKKKSYAKPILVGGTACMPTQYRNGYMKKFLDCYAKDTDPSKRLGFLSVHYYQDRDREAMLTLRRDIEAHLSSHRIPAVPLIMSEIGWKNPGAKAHDGNPKDALRWAIGSLAHTYQVAEQNVIPMHWVYPRKEDRHCMVSPASQTPALLPKGNAIKLAQMLKKYHAKSSIAVDGAGSGVYSVATFDESGVAILLFNYDAEGESSRAVALNLLKTSNLRAQTGRITEYFLDWNHGNYFANKDAWQMQPVDGGMKPLQALNDQVVTLKGNAAYMLLISFVA